MELCQNFLKTFPQSIHSFIVYGSVALGKATADSDIDIQIISDNPNALLNKKSEELVYNAQRTSGIKIMVNVKTASSIIEELVQGDSFHVLMVLNGFCLLKSPLFESIKSLVQKTPLPEKIIAENKIRNEIKNWSEEFFSKRLIQFLSDNSLSLFQFLAFKRVCQNNFQTWSDQEEKIQRASNHGPHVQELLPEFANSLNNFLVVNKNINTLNIELNPEYDFDLVNLLQSMRFIKNETQRFL